MIKCKVKDTNSDKFFEVTVTADIDNLSEEERASLQRDTVELAKRFANSIGWCEFFEPAEEIK